LRESVVRKFRTTAFDEKATSEYRKYKAKNLSEVEKAYLEAIKNTQKKLEKKKI